MENHATHNYINLEIGGNSYSVSLYLSIEDVLSISNHIAFGNSQHNLTVAKIIEKHLVPNAPKDSLCHKISSDNIILNTYIEALVNEDKTLESIYIQLTDDCNIVRRFIQAVNDMYKQQMKKSAVALVNAFEKSPQPQYSLLLQNQ